MTYHVKDLEAGPLLDQAVLRALGAVHEQDCPEGVPDNVRERWPAEGAMVLTDEAGNQMFYGMRNIPQFSTEWGVGGPIIERERIMLCPGNESDTSAKEWEAATESQDGSFTAHSQFAAKPLVAACRTLVFAEFGDTIDLIDGTARFGTPSVVQGPPR